MTRDEIIKLASAAGIAQHGVGFTCWEGQLERFAALVAAAEREACAKLLEDFNRFGDTRDCIAAIHARDVGHAVARLLSDPTRPLDTATGQITDPADAAFLDHYTRR